MVEPSPAGKPPPLPSEVDPSAPTAPYVPPVMTGPIGSGGAGRGSRSRGGGIGAFGRVGAIVAVVAIVAVSAGLLLGSRLTSGEAAATAAPTGTPATTRVPSPSPATTIVPQASSSATPVPTATATPQATPEPTPIPTAVPWQSIRSKRHHYTLQVPPDWLFRSGNAKDADVFEISNVGYPWLKINRDSVRKGFVASVSRTVPDLIKEMQTRYKARLLSNKAIRLANGYTGRLLTFSGTDSIGLPVTIQRVDVAKGRLAYFMDFFGATSDKAADVALFKRIYQGWRPTG